MLRRMKVYVGPVAVKETAERLRKVPNVTNVMEGTEHITFDYPQESMLSTETCLAWNASVDAESIGDFYLARILAAARLLGSVPHE